MMLKITKQLTYLSISHIRVKLIFQNFRSKKQNSEDSNIYDKLEKAIDSDPLENYNCCIALLNSAKKQTFTKEKSAI